MKKIRKIGIMFLVLAISISVIACGNQSKSKKVNDFSSKTEKESEEKLKASYGDGENRDFTTDGKLHEDKFLNKKFGYTDTSDEFEIKKEKDETIFQNDVCFHIGLLRGADVGRSDRHCFYDRHGGRSEFKFSGGLYTQSGKQCL